MSKLGRVSRFKGLGAAMALALVGSAAIAGFASAATLTLPRTYQVQAVDTPNLTANPSAVIGGDFGIGLTGAGDVNGDGKQDFIVGTDEHGGGPGNIFLISGADGLPIRTITSPDPGGTGTASSFGSYVGSIPDLGSCPGGTTGVVCPNLAVGPTDGVPDLLVTALGVDVTFDDPANSNNPATLVDAGRAYVVDGATGAILKKVQMPVQDLSDQLHVAAGPQKPAFGRTILNPAGRPPCAGNGKGVGACDSSPAAVQNGDVNSDGFPDFIVSASDYYETGATANPASPCAAAGPSANCLQAGRSYMFSGADVAGSNPSEILDTPMYTVKNPAAQPDDPNTSVNTNRENLGYSIEPIGDVGRCGLAVPVDPNGDPALGGDPCVNASSTGTPDGKPDILLSSHRTDDFGMFDVGVGLLLDGSNGSVLYTYHHPEPQPASLFAFSNYNQPAPGDLGQSTAPDIYQAAMRQNNPFTGGGKGYALNGAFKQPGSPNSISFATLTDPTPHPSEDFGTSSAGIGNVFGDNTAPTQNELLIGAYGPHNPGTNPDVINDVHIVDPIHEVDLQTIPAPDQQPGLGFGTALAPLGDLNGDGFLDFVVGAGLYDLTTSSPPCDVPPCANAGRVYIFRSDNSPAPPGGPTSQAGRSLEIDAPGSVRKGKAFAVKGLIEAFANDADCEPGQSVTVQRRRPGGFAYATIATVTSNGSGLFVKRVRERKTFVYRAKVAASAACDAAISNPQKVVVKKRRR